VLFIGFFERGDDENKLTAEKNVSKFSINIDNFVGFYIPFLFTNIKPRAAYCL